MKIEEMAKPIIFKDKIFDKYLITNDGRVYSVPAKKWIKLVEDKDGYMRTTLSNGKRGDKTTVMIAQAVLYTYVGNPPENMKRPSANHIDGNRKNNTVDNLEWMEHGTNSSIRQNKPVGSRNGRSILTEEDVRHICEILQAQTMTICKIAELYHVSNGAIESIKNHKNWLSISQNYSF